MRTILAVLCLLLPAISWAQTVPATVTLEWALPTQNTNGTPIPATGTGSLTKIQVWLATSPIPANTTSAPTVEITPVGTTTTRTVNVAPGGTVYARLKACNANLCSVFSNEVSAQIAQQPGVPTNVTIRITIG